MGSFPEFGAFVLRAQEKDGRTCINGLPVASPSKQMLGRFPMLQALEFDNLCAYLHFSETVVARDLVIVVMQHFDLTLKDILKAKNVSGPAKEGFYHQIAKAVSFLHHSGFVHGFLDISTVYTITEDDKITAKVSAYGLPFLTNNGKDVASMINFGTFMAPEMFFEDSSFAATYQTDVWDFGIVTLQIYWEIDLEEVITETEYIDILSEMYPSEQEGRAVHIMDELFKLLTDKKLLPKYEKVEWVEKVIKKCLQLNPDNRPKGSTLTELLNIPFSQDKNVFKVKTIKEMREDIKKKMDNTNGFEKLSIANSFYLWKTCGSTPENILLRKGIIQNHAPIAAYPCIRFDDFIPSDSGVDGQSTFDLGVLKLPNKRTLAKMEKNLKVSAKLFHHVKGHGTDHHSNANILYETSSNMLTVDHVLNGAAAVGVTSILPVISQCGVVPTQRAAIWSALLDITPSKYRNYLNLDVLAPHSSDRQLEVDIPRCHQYDSFMTTPAIQESLRKVLKGWQIITESDNYVYWQGCDSLATPFLLANMSSPHVAYACFKEFTYRYCHKFYLKDNSEVIKEYLAIFYHLVAYIDPVLYKHLKINGFDAELFAIPWFLTCFAHELPLSKLVKLWDETMMHGNSFPLMVALAMLNRLRDKLLAVSFNEMIIIIHDQPDLAIDEVIKNAVVYEKVIPPSCAFRMHASPWKADHADVLHSLDNTMSGLTLIELSKLHCPRLSTEEFIWRIKYSQIYVIDTRQDTEYEAEHVIDSFNHPNIQEADIDWLRSLPGIVSSQNPKCIIYGKNDQEDAEKLAEMYVMKGVPYVCLLHEPYESIPREEGLFLKN